MARETEHEREDVIAAIHQCKGKIALIARQLGVTPQTVHNYTHRWKTVGDAIEEARRDFREGLVDKAELKLEDAVMAGRAWAVKYALATQGKNRGYTERTEITGAEGGAVQVEYVNDWRNTGD